MTGWTIRGLAHPGNVNPRSFAPSMANRPYRSPDDPFAGNGGLSFRRLSAVRKVLSFQSRYNDTEPEDEWFGKRVKVLPGSIVANAEQEDHFSVEDVFHTYPMGYHVREGGTLLSEGVWKSEQQRQAIFNYCPELSMIMPMKLERERCEGDDGEGNLPPPPPEVEQDPEIVKAVEANVAMGGDGVRPEDAQPEGETKTDEGETKTDEAKTSNEEGGDGGASPAE